MCRHRTRAWLVLVDGFLSIKAGVLRPAGGLFFVGMRGVFFEAFCFVFFLSSSVLPLEGLDV